MILVDIISVILIGSSCALSTKFIEYLIGDPWEDKVNTRAIFSFIGVWIAQGYDRMERKIAEQMHSVSGLTKEKEEKMLSTKKNWFMAAGACYLCLNVYITLIICSVLFTHFDLSFWNLLIAYPVSHYTISHIM